mmetsp:Transcript_1266/g.2950  ORF Transcript_1266/g.2950 Transcript_1266/m.2950 type:complete len:111 (-) Transcript_1266:1372-1704(-)
MLKLTNANVVRLQFLETDAPFRKPQTDVLRNTACMSCMSRYDEQVHPSQNIPAKTIISYARLLFSAHDNSKRSDVKMFRAANDAALILRFVLCTMPNRLSPQDIFSCHTN